MKPIRLRIHGKPRNPDDPLSPYDIHLEDAETGRALVARAFTLHVDAQNGRVEFDLLGVRANEVDLENVPTKGGEA